MDMCGKQRGKLFSRVIGVLSVPGKILSPLSDVGGQRLNGVESVSREITSMCGRSFIGVVLKDTNGIRCGVGFSKETGARNVVVRSLGQRAGQRYPHQVQVTGVRNFPSGV